MLTGPLPLEAVGGECVRHLFWLPVASSLLGFWLHYSNPFLHLHIVPSSVFIKSLLLPSYKVSSYKDTWLDLGPMWIIQDIPSKLRSLTESHLQMPFFPSTFTAQGLVPDLFGGGYSASSTTPQKWLEWSSKAKDCRSSGNGKMVRWEILRSFFNFFSENTKIYFTHTHKVRREKLRMETWPRDPQNHRVCKL